MATTDISIFIDEEPDATPTIEFVDGNATYQLAFSGVVGRYAMRITGEGALTFLVRWEKESVEKKKSYSISFVPAVLPSVNVLPLVGRIAQRSVNNEIPIFVSELAVLTVSCVDRLNVPVVLTGKTLRLAIETKHKVVVEELTPTISGTTAFTFQVTSDMSEKEQLLEWSLWDVTSLSAKTFLMGGPMPVTYKPL